MDKLQFVYTSDVRPVIRSQWGYQGTAYGCMNCGFGVRAPIYNYCPNCGAVMSDKVTGKIAPVNVVHCKDCTSWEADWKPNYAQNDEHFCPMVAFVTRGDWFCAYGERREEKHGNSNDT